MDPATLALILKMAPMLIEPIAQAIPGPMEEQNRRDIEAEGKALREATSGLSAGQRGVMRSEGQNAIQAQQAQQLAMLARGNAQGYDAGAAGISGNAMRDVARLGAQQDAKLESGIRQQDIAALEARRKVYDERLRAAMEQGYRRKQDTLKAVGSATSGAEGFGLGQTKRLGDAAGIGGGADAINAGAGLALPV